MLLKKTNIEEKLAKLKKDTNTTDVLKEVQDILNEVSKNHLRINNTLNSPHNKTANCFNFELLQTQNIYHISQIKQICITYRLRFLDSNYFKGELPQEAIHKISAIEKAHDLELNGFKIIAPSKLFKLVDKDDPLLFAPIGNNYYYLIHKWGNDLHPLRKLMMWPFKNMVNLAWVTLLASFLLTLLIPHGLFSKTNTNAQFLVLFFFTFKSAVAVVIFYGLAMRKSFNSAIWKSKFI